MNETSKSTEKKSEKMNEILSSREKILLKKGEVNTNYIHTCINNQVLYDIISIQERLIYNEKGSYLQSGIKDDYVLSEMKKPFLCLGKKSLVVVINFGRPPSETQTNFIKSHYKIPINYKAKRLFYKHNKAENKDMPFMFFTCKITNKKNSPFYSVVTDDGLRFSGGKELIKELNSIFDFEFEFKNIDDFFGLLESGIQKERENRS